MERHDTDQRDAGGIAAEAADGGGSGAGESLEEELFEVLSQHTLTNQQSADWGYFDNAEQASKWYRRRRQKGLIFWDGCVVRLKPNGRPEKQWSRGWIPKKNQPLHEYLLTDACLTLDADRIERQQADKLVRPDSEAWWYRLKDDEGKDYDAHWYLELSTGPGSMTVKEIAEKRFPKYRDTKDPVLWICHGVNRKEAEQWAGWLAKRAGTMTMPFFTTTYRLIDGGNLTIFDREGNEARLPEHESGAET